MAQRPSATNTEPPLLKPLLKRSNSMSNFDFSRLQEILTYCPRTGLFTWKTAPRGRKVGQIAGTKDREGYIRIRIDYVKYAAHRLAWMFVHGDFPKMFIDHINGVKHDNRICNLRDVTRSVNMQNLRRPQGQNKFLGVYKRPKSKKWRAKIQVNGKQINLGTFLTEVAARNAYIEAKRIYHPSAPEH
jgi:hypothetical protein